MIDRLKVAGRGIILLHDPKAQTAAMLPAFLRYLRDNGYHVVHVVPTGPALTLTGLPDLKTVWKLGWLMLHSSRGRVIIRTRDGNADGASWSVVGVR